MAEILEEIDLSSYAPEQAGFLEEPLMPTRRYRNSLTGTFPLPSADPALNMAPARPGVTRYPEDAALIEGMKPEVPAQSLEQNAAALGWTPEPNIVMGDKDRIERAKSIAATLDIPFADAYDGEPGYNQSLSMFDKNWFKLAGTQWMSSTGQIHTTLGRAMKMLGLESLGEAELQFGQRLENAYIPQYTPKELLWDKVRDPAWWATTIVGSIPASLALVPAAVVGAYAGGATATAVGLGKFGQVVLTALGAGTASRTGTAALEANQSYEQAIAEKKSPDEAYQIGTKVFTANMALSGLDAAELALAFTPLRVFGRSVPKILQRRALAAGIRLGGELALEPIEEGTQQMIQQWAAGGRFFDFTPEVQEAMAAGLVFGLGMTGAGSVYRGLTGHVENHIPAKIADQYVADFQTNMALGQDEDTARLNALDKLAATPEGEQIVKDAMADLHDKVDGKAQPTTQEEMTADIDGKLDAEMFDAAIPESDVNTLIEPNFDAVAKGELSIEEVMGEPAPAVTPEAAAQAEAQAKGDNFFISEETYAKAKAALKEKTSGLHAGFDPTSLIDLTTMGLYHIERFGRNFAEWSKAMVENFGEISADLLAKAWSTAIKHADIGERAKVKASEMIAAKPARTSQQAIGAAIDDHIRMLAESPSDFLYNGKVYAKAVKEKNNIRLIGESGDTLVRGRSILNIEENVPVDVPGEAAGQRPLSEHALEIKTMVREMERATMPARDVKRMVRLTTGQERIVKTIREDVALRASFKKAEQNARIAYREGSKDGMLRAKSEMRDVMMKAKVKAENQAFALGYKYAEKITGQEMREAFKAEEKHQADTRQALTELIQEHLPPELQGEFLDAMVKKFTEKRAGKVLDRIAEASETHTKQELIDDTLDIFQHKGRIDVEYQKQITALLKDFNFKELTPRMKEKIQDFIDYSNLNGLPSGISAKMLMDVERLSLRQAHEMTVDDLRALRDMAAHLHALGKATRSLNMRYNESERLIALDRLLEDTHNIDPKSEAGKSALAFHLETLSPLRAAEIMDGYKSRRQNYKLMQSLSQHETTAQWTTHTEIDSALQDAIAAGIETVDETRYPVIMANIRMLEGSETAAKTIIEKHGLTDLTLTPQEEALIKIFEKYTNRHVDRLAALYEHITNMPFVKRDRYILPLKYEGEFNLNPEEVILQTPHAATQTGRGMTIERKKGVTKEPRVDIWGVFEQAINEQQWFLEMQPALDNVRQLVKTKAYTEKAGAMAADYWTKHIDIVARRGWSNKAMHDQISKALKFARGNITTAILSYRLSSIIMQPFAIFQALAHISAEFGPTASAAVLAEFGKAWIVPGYAEWIISQSEALQQRQAGEVAVSEALAKARGGSLKDKFIRSGLKLLQKGDVITAAGVQQGVQRILERRGVANAHAEAETIMQLVSSSSDVSLRPHILARGEGMRTMFTFQTFALNNWGIISHDLIAKGIGHGDFKKKLGALVGLGILVAGQAAEDETREFIWEMVKRRDRPERGADMSGLVKAAYSQAKNAPFVGPMFDLMSGHGGSSEAPLVKLMNEFIRGLFVTPLTQKETATSEKAWHAFYKAVEAGAIVFGGAPGTSQGFDVLEGLLFPGKER